MSRAIWGLIAAACLVALVFTDLDLTQRLLLIGVAMPSAVLILWDQLK